MTAEDGAGSLLRIHVRFYNIIADHVGKRDEVRWVADGSTIDDLLRLLAAEYPALRRYAHTDALPSWSPFRLFRNGGIIINTDEPLASKDEIRIFPIVSGG